MADPILYTGWSALNASSYAISIAANNIANADTDGYNRQVVDFTEAYAVDTPNGYMGLGVDIQGVTRAFDLYLEEMFLSEWSGANRWATQSQWMGYVENTFNQTDENGINNALSDFYQAWDDLAANPDDPATLSALLGFTETMNSILTDMANDLKEQEAQINSEISSQVDEVNEKLNDLADLNSQIIANPDNNTLLDQRDLLLRELAEYMDIETQYGANGDVTVYTGSGQPLVAGDRAFDIKYESSKSWASLTGDSTFEGKVYFDGESNGEIILEVVNAGTVDGGAGAAEYRVSLDGGQTWMTDENGDQILYAADGESGAIEVDGVSIWLGAADDSSALGSGELAVGDTFTVMAKSGVYWYENTSTFENITPLESTTGGDEDDRMTGGSLAGLLSARDSMLGEYQDELEAFTDALIWQTNFAYSQGASTNHFDTVTGTYAAEDTSVPLSESGLEYAAYLQDGTFSMALYDEATGDSLGVTSVDFSSIVPPGTATFDPDVHSLDDVAQAINDTFGGQVTASISNGALSLDSAAGVEFEFAGDTTGLLAACGINTYFTGTSADDIGINTNVSGSPSHINAGAVDASGLVAEGSNTTALAIFALQDKEVDILQSDGTVVTDSMAGYLNSLVSLVGADSAHCLSNYSYHYSLADELNSQQSSVSGVNIDEELIRIEQYQRLYQAASSMIETSNEMFDTVIALL